MESEDFDEIIYWEALGHLSLLGIIYGMTTRFIQLAELCPKRLV